MLEKSVNVFKKLDKVPVFVWCLAVIVSAFFANMYTLFRVISPSYLQGLLEDSVIMSGSALTSGALDATPVWILIVISTPLLVWGIFELIISLVYRNLYIRRQINANVKFYRLVLRISYSVANVLIGLFSLIYFAVEPDISGIGSLIFDISVMLAVFTYAYGVLSWSVISPNAVAKAYLRIMSFFCIMFSIISVYDVVIYAAQLTDELVLDFIGCCVHLAIIVAYALVGKFVIYKKLLKRQESYVEVKIVTPSNTPEPPDEVFKGFGL